MERISLQVPWDRIIILIIGLAVIASATYLAASDIAPWGDVFTIFMVILTGFGFLTAGYYAGRASTYERIFERLGLTELEATLKRGE